MIKEKIKTINENIWLSVVTGLALIALLTAEAFLPGYPLPDISIPAISAVCLTALVLNHYFTGKTRGDFLLNLLAGEVIFGLMPLAGGFTVGEEAAMTALIGGAFYALISWLFASMVERMESTLSGKLAPVSTAFILFLGCQCFTNILL